MVILILALILLFLASSGGSESSSHIDDSIRPVDRRLPNRSRRNTLQASFHSPDFLPLASFPSADGFKLPRPGSYPGRVASAPLNFDPLPGIPFHPLFDQDSPESMASLSSKPSRAEPRAAAFECSSEVFPGADCDVVNTLVLVDDHHRRVDDAYLHGCFPEMFPKHHHLGSGVSFKECTSPGSLFCSASVPNSLEPLGRETTRHQSSFVSNLPPMASLPGFRQLAGTPTPEILPN